MMLIIFYREETVHIITSQLFKKDEKAKVMLK